MSMKFGSVCSGIEAASVAWEPLGWKAAWFSEIEAFPSAVLAHHYPTVPNLGDMMALPERIRSGEVEAPDVLCGGTPCQAFSVAGSRKSLDDARGNLSLTFCEIANAIDDVRTTAGKQASIVFWENVPGVLTTKDNAFGCFLGELAGESCALQPPGGKWSNAGCVYGPSRAIAWRVLDAQYFGVAQRRRRVFVVASARDGFDPASILFEFDRLRRDTAPRREPGAAVAALTSSGVGTCGADDNQAQAGHLIPGAFNFQASQSGVRINDTVGTLDANYGSRRHNGVLYPVAFGGNNTAGPIDVAPALNACASASGRMDFESEAFLVECVTGDITHTLKAEGFDASEDGTGRGQPIVPWWQGLVWRVRRLMPVECERLQGFPDGYTRVPYRKKAADACPDGPRYKALGNSWAVPNVRWIGQRIAMAVAFADQANDNAPKRGTKAA